jgi:hypothetical protein
MLLSFCRQFCTPRKETYVRGATTNTLLEQSRFCIAKSMPLVDMSTRHPALRSLKLSARGEKHDVRKLFVTQAAVRREKSTSRSRFCTRVTTKIDRQEKLTHSPLSTHFDPQTGPALSMSCVGKQQIFTELLSVTGEEGRSQLFLPGN